MSYQNMYSFKNKTFYLLRNSISIEEFAQFEYLVFYRSYTEKHVLFQPLCTKDPIHAVEIPLVMFSLN